MKFSHALLTAITTISITLLASCSSHDHAPPEVAKLKVTNLKQPQRFIYASGQPTKEQLKSLADTGMKHVVSLRPASETDWDEEKYVRELGMAYISIPISGPSDLTKANAKKLDAAITLIGKDPAMIHCSSGNRVGGLIAIRKATLKGASKSEALATGQRWGLTKMKPAVSAKLSEMGY